MILLHVHNSDSILDGLGTQLQNAEIAASLGQTALSESNHSTLSGSLKHIKACNKVGIMPINGIEGYFRPNRLVRDKDWRFRKWHYLLLAKNLKGWHNLIKISSEAYSKESFYQFPCFDWALLEKYHEGLIASSACILGPLPFLIENGSEKEVDEFVVRSKRIFGEDFYISVMPHNFDRQRSVNLELISLANKHGIPIVYEGDSHYPKKSWVDTQKIAILIGTNSTFADAEAQNKKRIENNEEIYELWHDGLHIMGEKEVSETFARNHPDISSAIVDEAIRNTDYIGSKIEPFIFDRSVKMPRAGKSPDDAEKQVIQWCKEGLIRTGRSGDEVYEKRLAYELGVLRKRNNFPYILLVSDWIRWCKSEDPLPGKEGKKRKMLLTCRGSAAASIVCYLTNITAIDPIAHKFKFERFINPERKGQPDIDIDLPSKRRNEAKEYLAIKYGEDSIADIMAQQHFQPRAALKNVTKVIYGFDSEVYKTISEICHEDSGLIDKVHDIDLEKMKERIPELNSWAQNWPECWEQAVRLENAGEPFVSRISKHAAGTAITPGPITDYIPTIRADDKEVGSRTAWAETSRYSIVDEVGIIKIDALGIDGKDQHESIIDLVKERTGVEVDIDNLRCLKDPNNVDLKVMELAQQGINLGVNQFSGAGITNYLKKLRPNNIFDLTAANALYRPGGMGEKGHIYYANRKNGLEAYTIPEPLQEALGETYAVMPYQESVMSVFQVLMGYSAGQADDVRKTIDKENRAKNQAGRAKLNSLKTEFIERASKIVGEDIAESTWDAILPWTSYGFNRPHAGCYACEGYKDWYLKYHYPLETYSVILSEFKSKGEKEKEKFIKSAIKEARYFNISLLPPDINISNSDYTPDFENNALRYGLIGIKGIAEISADQVMELRPYLSLEDFEKKHTFKYSKVNKGHRQKLLEVGALDSLGGRAKWTDTEKSQKEMELLGMALSPGGTLGENESLIISRTHSESEYQELEVGSNVVIGGVISEVKPTKTKKGKNPGQEMGFFRVSLGLDSFQCTLFPPAWTANKSLIKVGEKVMVNGRKDERGIIVNNTMSVEDFINEIREQEMSVAA
jgi:DNA polymerase-3 subunit alpha